MRSKLTRIVLAATLALALAFTFGCPSSSDDEPPPSGSCTGDPVTIGTQVWQKCNLNVVPSTGNSACYNNDPANCAKYGRLYDWAAANIVCPSGWHLPSNAEWDKLYRHADGTSGTESPYSSFTAGGKLKAVDGWDESGNGTDEFNFSALPGGDGDSDNRFTRVGKRGYWWSSSEYDSDNAYGRYMGYNFESADGDYYGKSRLFSVRCVKNL